MICWIYEIIRHMKLMLNSTLAWWVGVWLSIVCSGWRMVGVTVVIVG